MILKNYISGLNNANNFYQLYLIQAYEKISQAFRGDTELKTPNRIFMWVILIFNFYFANFFFGSTNRKLTDNIVPLHFPPD